MSLDDYYNTDPDVDHDQDWEDRDFLYDDEIEYLEEEHDRELMEYWNE